MSARSGRSRALLLLIAVALIGGAAVLAYRLQAAGRPDAPIVGMVRETELRIAPDANGRLQSLRVVAGQSVKKGELLALLSNPELEASVLEAKAAAQQTLADRNNVFAGVRREEQDIAGQNVRTAEANLLLAHLQYDRAATLASKSFLSKQKLDENAASLREAEAALELARSAEARDKAGPTREEQIVADSQVTLSDAKVADLEAQFAKTQLLAPTDGIIALLVAEPGEVIAPGASVLTMTTGRGQWFSFTVREDRLHGLTVGSKQKVMLDTGETIEGKVAEMRPLGEFATWRAARAVGDHDLNSFLVRIDPVAPLPTLRPGMTVSLWATPQTDHDDEASWGERTIDSVTDLLRTFRLFAQ
ncbi:MAG: efflux RND transporter periplasmic adaptor subunit [Hyphomicrobiales bacterium]|nr:efflux RND transporter periplasmic adaptor subunit [Hyphomicrobiales bacterium]